MSGDFELDKQTSAAPAPPPRMLGDSDVRVILQFAAQLQPDAQILEIGPWLGGLTTLLATFGRVTVLDRFVWSEANAENYPGIAAPEASFRPVFEAHMQAAGLVVDVIETTLPEFDWSGGPLDFVFIDAPRDAALLHACFKAIAAALRPGSRILVKHALNEQNFGMGAYLDALAGLGLVRIEASEQPDWCNIAAVTVLGPMDRIADTDDADELIANAPVTDGFTDPWYGHRLTLFRLAYLGAQERWTDAFAHLARMPTDSDLLMRWSEFEGLLLAKLDDRNQSYLAVLSEVIWIHNDQNPLRTLPMRAGAAFAPRLAAYWRNNFGESWLCAGLVPEILGDEGAGPTITTFASASGQIYKERVVAIGQEVGSAALAALIYGARAFTGFEMGEPSPLGQQIGEVCPHFSVAPDHSGLLDAIDHATVIIVDKDLSNRGAIATAIKAKEATASAKVIVL